MGVLIVSGVKLHSREKQPSVCVKSFQGLNDIAERNSPVGVLKVSGVKVRSREKQPCGCVKSVRG